MIRICIAFGIAGILTGVFITNNKDVFLNTIQEYYHKTFPVFKHENVFTLKELSEFNGDTRSKLYLAFMGTVYDVSKGSKHYGKGSPYNYFVGKDGTRAFATGNFNDESDNKDHILDLTCDELLGLVSWNNAIKEKYKAVGFLIGRYYDKEAKDTNYHIQCRDRISRCLMQKEEDKKEDQKFPPCNIAWDAEAGSRVWCTKLSGGITRDWAGVPRQYYSPGTEKPRCVCVNVTKEPPNGMLKEYNNCPNTSTSCNIETE